MTTTSTAADSPLTRTRLLEEFREVRAFSTRLCAPLEIEDYVVQSMEDASPIRWHLGHTTWFFETFLIRENDSDYRSPHPQFAYLFNSYYARAGDRYPRPHRGLITRPTVAETMDYRSSVDQAVEHLVERLSESDWTELAPVLELGIQHEQQHQELMLTDLKHALSFNPLYPAYQPVDERAASCERISAGWREFAGDIFSIGHCGTTFCFDNERPRHRVLLEAFELGNRLVSSGEFLEFIRDGGYRTETLWLSDGWTVARDRSWEAPLYWVEREGQWLQFTLQGLRPVVETEPVCHVSFYEADAYARWAGCRLPTEAEWEVAASQTVVDGHFAESGYFHPGPADLKDGISQLYGDVWEWTASPYVGYPGYRPVEGVLGEYNGKFMANQVVLRGGSCATSRSHIRATYRNFFHPPKRWQFSGFRLAR